MRWAVLRSSLSLASVFRFGSAISPIDGANRDYYCPVAERAGYEESVWLPHYLFLGNDRDIADIVAAIEKIREHADELVDFENEAVRIQGLSRAERALLESEAPY